MLHLRRANIITLIIFSYRATVFPKAIKRKNIRTTEWNFAINVQNAFHIYISWRNTNIFHWNVVKSSFRDIHRPGYRRAVFRNNDIFSIIISFKTSTVWWWRIKILYVHSNRYRRIAGSFVLLAIFRICFCGGSHTRSGHQVKTFILFFVALIR